MSLLQQPSVKRRTKKGNGAVQRHVDKFRTRKNQETQDSLDYEFEQIRQLSQLSFEDFLLAESKLTASHPYNCLDFDDGIEVSVPSVFELLPSNDQTCRYEDTMDHDNQYETITSSFSDLAEIKTTLQFMNNISYQVPKDAPKLKIFIDSTVQPVMVDKEYIQPCLMNDQSCNNHECKQMVDKPIGFCIYACPGSGKTTFLKTLDSSVLGSIRDTDHDNGSLSNGKIILTNRPDVLAANRGIALIPSKLVWIQRVQSKIPVSYETASQWFDEMLNILSACNSQVVKIHSDLYFSQVFDIVRRLQP